MRDLRGLIDVIVVVVSFGRWPPGSRCWLWTSCFFLEGHLPPDGDEDEGIAVHDVKILCNHSVSRSPDRGSRR